MDDDHPERWVITTRFQPFEKPEGRYVREGIDGVDGAYTVHGPMPQAGVEDFISERKSEIVTTMERLRVNAGAGSIGRFHAGDEIVRQARRRDVD